MKQNFYDKLLDKYFLGDLYCINANVQYCCVTRTNVVRLGSSFKVDAPT